MSNVIEDNESLLNTQNSHDETALKYVYVLHDCKPFAN